MEKTDEREIAIIGTGIVGIATAYYLCKKYQRKSVLLIDPRDPMSYTSAQSGDNYRNWWPSELMTKFTDHSIGLMHEIARDSSNALQMKQSGYALATRRKEIDDLIATLDANYRKSDGLIRFHNEANTRTYETPHAQDWKSPIDGVDVISNKTLINKVFPAFSPDIEHVLHIRRAGDISGQQMGQYMLQQVKSLGCARLRGRVRSVVKNLQYEMEIETKDGVLIMKADTLVNAAGPYAGDVASMLGIELPIENIFHQKLAFEDTRAAIPRNQPFSINIDTVSLDWSDEEKLALSEDDNLSWLTRPIDGGIHCRPEGTGRWIKLGWAYNRQPSVPDNTKELIEDPMFNPNFPEIVLRGASKLNPDLKPYIENLPKNRVHYGGYYTMTKENWPLIGPLDDSGAYVAGAMSGFGSMAACAAGSICADWVCGGQLPSFANALSLARYKDSQIMNQIEISEDVGLL